MKTVRVSDSGGRYTRGILSEGIFTPEQTRYLLEELDRISALIANHDEALVEIRGISYPGRDYSFMDGGNVQSQDGAYLYFN